MKKIILFLLATSLLSGCKRNPSDAETLLTVDFRIKQENNLTEILEMDFLKLETGENCLVDKTINQLEQVGDKIFILTGGKRDMLVFDRMGKFVSAVGSKGTGPGEYVLPASFSINTDKNIFTVSDIGQMKIISYRLDDFTFVDEQEMKYHNFCFEFLGKDKIVWKNINYDQEYSDWEFIITDYNQEYLDWEVEKSFKSGYSTGRMKTIYKRDDKVFGYAQYNPSLYCFTEDGMTTYCRFTFGKYKLPPVSYLEQISTGNVNFIPELMKSEYISRYSLFDTGQTLAAYYFVSEVPYIGLYKETGNEAYGYPQNKFEEYLKIGKLNNIVGVAGDWIVGTLYPFELLDLLAEGYQFPHKLEDLLNESTLDDNPILIMFRVK